MIKILTNLFLQTNDKNDNFNYFKTKEVLLGYFFSLSLFSIKMLKTVFPLEHSFVINFPCKIQSFAFDLSFVAFFN